MTNHSQTVLYGELLDSEQQFRVDVDQLPRYTEQERQALIDRAREGDNEARNAFALSFMGYVTTVARRYVNKHMDLYDFSSSRVEFLDLVQDANYIILEYMGKALRHPNPIGYLHRTIDGRIMNFLKTRTGMIVMPQDYKDTAPVVESLDAPLDESNLTLNGVLSCDLDFREKQKDYSPVYHALDELTAFEKEIVLCVHGIGCASETLTEIMNRKRRAEGKRPVKSNKVSDSSKRRAMAKLQKLLGPVYGDVYTRKEASTLLGVTEEQFCGIAYRYQLKANPNGMYPKRPVDLLAHTYHSSNMLPSMHVHSTSLAV
jgi:hypothetical protein